MIFDDVQKDNSDKKNAKPLKRKVSPPFNLANILLRDVVRSATGLVIKTQLQFFFFQMGCMKIYNINRVSPMVSVLQCSLIVYAGWQDGALCSQLFPTLHPIF